MFSADKFFSWSLIAISLSGCAVAIPNNQTFSPQTLGKNGIEVALVSGVGPSLGPKLFDGSESESGNVGQVYVGYRFGYGILNNLDLELETIASMFGGSSLSYGVKYQWMGEPIFSGKGGSWNSAIRVRYFSQGGFRDEPGKGDSSIFDNVFVEKMDATGFHVGNSFGYLVTDWFGFYVGAQVSNLKLDFEYREPDENGPLVKGSREAIAYGPFLGLHLNTTGTKWFRFYYSTEVEAMNVPNTYEDGTSWLVGYASTLSLVFRF